MDGEVRISKGEQMNDELLRLEALKLAIKTISPNAHDPKRHLLAHAEIIFDYIKTGKYQINIVESSG